LLAAALGLAAPVRPSFVAAARGRSPAAGVLAALRGEAHGGGLAWPECPYLGLVPFQERDARLFTGATNWPPSWCGGLWRGSATTGTPPKTPPSPSWDPGQIRVVAFGGATYILEGYGITAASFAHDYKILLGTFTPHRHDGTSS
jgi:hypothetical protein